MRYGPPSVICPCAKIVIGNGQWNELLVGDRRKADLVLAGDLVSRIAGREETAVTGEVVTVQSRTALPHMDFPQPSVPDEAFVVPGSDPGPGEHRAVSILFLNVTRQRRDNLELRLL